MSGPKLDIPSQGLLTKHLIQVRLNDVIFIYADCLSGYLYHEQTKVFSQQPNCFGIPVCWCFDRYDDANYFTDNQSFMYEGLIVKEIEAALNYKQEHTYWIQPDLGKNYMETQCPKLYEFLKKQLERLT